MYIHIGMFETINLQNCFKFARIEIGRQIVRLTNIIEKNR